MKLLSAEFVTSVGPTSPLPVAQLPHAELLVEVPVGESLQQREAVDAVGEEGRAVLGEADDPLQPLRHGRRRPPREQRLRRRGRGRLLLRPPPRARRLW